MPMLIMLTNFNYTSLIPNPVINLDWTYKEREIDTEPQVSVARYRKEMFRRSLLKKSSGVTSVSVCYRSSVDTHKQHQLAAPAVEGEGSFDQGEKTPRTLRGTETLYPTVHESCWAHIQRNMGYISPVVHWDICVNHPTGDSTWEEPKIM